MFDNKTPQKQLSADSKFLSYLNMAYLQGRSLMDVLPSNVPGLMSTADRALSGMSGLSEKTELDLVSKIDNSARAPEPTAVAGSERQALGEPERLSLDTEPDTAGRQASMCLCLAL